jgi:LysM repeat protein
LYATKEYMGHLEKRIIIGALGLVAVLLTVVIFKGLTPSDQEVLYISLDPVPVEIRELVTPWPANTTQSDIGETSLAENKEFVAPPQIEEVLPVDDRIVEVIDEPAVRLTKTLYTIKSGDILGMIAQTELGSVRYVGKIKELNPGLIDSNLVIGDVLVLPAKHTLIEKVEVKEALATSSENIHVVVAGDSLTVIAGKYYPGKYEYIEKIVSENKKLLVNGKNTVLRVGWKLNLPE